jgi:hypothetical protein
MPVKKIQRLHSDHTHWLQSLDFIQDELLCFWHELLLLSKEPLVSKKEVKAAKTEIDDFVREISEVRYTIHLHETYLAEEAAKGRFLDFDHCSEADKLNAFLDKYNQFKSRNRNSTSGLLRRVHENLFD